MTPFPDVFEFDSSSFISDTKDIDSSNSSIPSPLRAETCTDKTSPP